MQNIELNVEGTFLIHKRDPAKVNVFLIITKSKMYVPVYLAKATVIVTIVLEMLKQFLELQLLTNDTLPTLLYRIWHHTIGQ